MSRRLLAALFATALVLAACGDDDDAEDGATTTEASDDGATTTEASDDGATTTEAPDDTAMTTTTAASDDAAADTTTTAPADDGATGGEDAPVTTASTDLGDVLVDAEGFTLYGFTNDSAGTPTCTDACADTWPPLYVDSETLPEGLDASVFSVVEHPSGQFQLKAGDWPLYLYAPDAAPGDTNGQGVGDIWFAVDPQGELIMQ